METNEPLLKEMGRICSQVAHDMRVPLASITLGITTLLDPDKTALEQTETLRIMRQCAEKMDRMIQELLEYRLACELQKTPVDIANLVQDACREQFILAHKAKVQMAVIRSDHTMLSVDIHKIGRVVQNLLLNAIQVTSGHSPAQVLVSAISEKRQVVIRIRDTGPGLPQENLHRVFRDAFTTRGRSGNGLGLIYCRTVVEAHGGEITANNHPDGGAEFVVFLPYQAAD